MLLKRDNPQLFLLIMAFVMAANFALWQTLLNNFVVERAAFSGAEIGLLQSIREIPGFLAFTVIWVLLLIGEQRLMILSMAILCCGVALTGQFPTAIGLYLTTLLMSTGFHYFETVNQSLTLQWVNKDETPQFLGRATAVKAAASLLAYGGIWLAFSWFKIDYPMLYWLSGALGLMVVIIAAWWMPKYPIHHAQHRKMIVRKRYWLFYALTFFSGARRQIFVVFASFMMVEKFDYGVEEIAGLFVLNHVFNLLFAPTIGRWIGRVGERRALQFEYIGLIGVFTGYALVESAHVAAGLYVIDHLFFALAIAVKTYFQKIADPKDMAATAGVSFTINHIAAVVIPVLLGILWLESPGSVFSVGVGLAVSSLILASLVPTNPMPGREWLGQPAPEDNPIASQADIAEPK
jgi:hypothetical protein